MEKTKNIPKIRFKGYKDEWEKKELKELATMHARIGWQNLRTSEFLESGDYMLITGTDFNDGKINYDTCYYVEKYRYDQDKNIQLKNGNILITKDGSIGKVAFVENLHKPATLNAGVFNIEVKNSKEVNNKYLFEYLRAPFLMDYVDKTATGGTIKHLNQNILVNFIVNAPNINEQKQIGDLLYNLNEKLEIEREKHEKLVNFKKAMLENVFPKEGEKRPKIRFGGYNDDWEETQLNDIGKKYTSLTGKTKEDFGHGEGRYITFTNILANPVALLEGVEKIEVDKRQNDVKNGDLFFNISSETYEEVGMSSVWTYDKENYYLNSFCMGFRPSIELDRYFITYLLRSQAVRKQIMKLAQGISRINISQNKMLDIYLSIPSINEQKLIGSFFKNLDEKIQVSEEKITKIENFKKAMMDGLFV